MDRASGELLVAEKYDPAVNWATHVDMKTGRPQVVDRYSTAHQGEDVNKTYDHVEYEIRDLGDPESCLKQRCQGCVRHPQEVC